MEVFVIKVGSYYGMIVSLKAEYISGSISAALFVTYNESSTTVVDLDKTSAESALKEP